MNETKRGADRLDFYMRPVCSLLGGGQRDLPGGVEISPTAALLRQAEILSGVKPFGSPSVDSELRVEEDSKLVWDWLRYDFVEIHERVRNTYEE